MQTLQETNREARQAALAGTRMLILENIFDALIETLVASGAIPQNAASVLLESLAERFIAHSEKSLPTEWEIDPAELRDHASRLRRRSGCAASHGAGAQ